MPIEQFLITISPLLVYVAVGVVIGIESFGVPLPGEIVLVTAALLSARPEFGISPWGVAIGGITGAIIGDSIGYAIGRRYGRSLFDRLGRRFPKHFGPAHVLFAERVFARYGVLAVFFGRFIALLRILAGPLAGALRMRYGAFLAANALGAVAWAGGTTAGIYYLGVVAEMWLHRFSWIGLLVAVVAGLTLGLVVKRKTNRMAHRYAEQHAAADRGAAHDETDRAGAEPLTRPAAPASGPSSPGTAPPAPR